MGEKWLKDFQRFLDRAAPTISTTGFGKSRRIEDYYGEVEVERQCYENVYCFIQKGLLPHAASISKVLDLVNSFQRDRERGEYTLYMYHLGTDHNKLAQSESVLANHNTNASVIARRLCGVSGSDPLKEPSCIAKFGRSTTDDLILFFCHDRKNVLSSKSRGTYQSRKRRIFWFFFGGSETEISSGKEFQPEFIENAS
jgi:hypothetical protein